MPNRLTNAGFLDEAQGWTSSAALALSVAETGRGAPGRLVLRGVGTATSNGQILVVQPATGSRPAAAPGETVEVSGAIAAFVGGVPATPTARLVFRDAGGSQVGATDLGVVAPAQPQHGVGLAGLRETFHRVFGRALAPASTATATVEHRVTANSGQAVEVAVLKPLLDAVPQGRREPLLWDPGEHVETDLQLDVWPGLLKPFQARGGSEPKPSRVEFGSAMDRPVGRRTALDPARRYEGLIRCDPVQRAALEAFARTAGDFWIVEPDSDRLCVGSFAADGAPRMAEARGPTVMMGVALWLETA